MDDGFRKAYEFEDSGPPLGVTLFQIFCFVVELVQGVILLAGYQDMGLFPSGLVLPLVSVFLGASILMGLSVRIFRPLVRVLLLPWMILRLGILIPLFINNMYILLAQIQAAIPPGSPDLAAQLASQHSATFITVTVNVVFSLLWILVFRIQPKARAWLRFKGPKAVPPASDDQE